MATTADRRAGGDEQHAADAVPAPARFWRLSSSGPDRGLAIISRLFSRLPLQAAYLIAIALAPVWFLHFNKPRLAVVAAMRRMGFRFPWWRALAVYASYARVLVDRHYIQTGRLSPTLEGARRAWG